MFSSVRISANLDSVGTMATNMSEVTEALKKISTEVSTFTARQDQLEAIQEQTCRNQEQALSELREVLNEVIHDMERPERDKSVAYSGGELTLPTTNLLILET